MLTLAPPIYVVDGVTLMRDSERADQFYYAPMEPRVALMRQQVTGAEVPVLKLFKLSEPVDGTAGFLVFDTTLGLRPDEHAKIVTELQSLAGLPDPPIVSPVPLLDGTVRLIMLGRESGVPSTTPVAPGTPPDGFVTGISHPAKPALYADNRAVFSVSLTQAGATIVDRAMHGEIMPLGVVYSLQFLALRPAFRFTIEADWERVQKHFEETVGTSSMLHEAKISTIIDSLIEDHVIRIDTATFVPDDEENAAVIDQRDQLLDELKSMILETFFTPSLDPITQKTTGWDEVANGVSSLRKAFHSGGVNGLFNYNRQDVTRLDRRTFNTEVTSSTTIRRSIYPQAHLQGLAGMVTKLGLDVDDFIEEVLPDPFFQNRTVTVLTQTDFAADGIGRIQVRVRYGQHEKDVVLDAAHQTETVTFDSIVERGVMRRAVDVDYTVTFTGADASERPVRLTSPAREYTTNNVEIIPRELYTVTPIPVRVQPGVFAEYPQIDVQLRYRDDARSIAMDDVVRLDERTPTATWRQFSIGRGPADFDYRIRYHGTGLEDRQTPWRTADEEQVVVKHPAANRITVTVLPPSPFDRLDFVFVDLSVPHPETGGVVERSVQFDKDHRTMQQVLFEVPAAQPVLLTYRVTLLYTNGVLVELPDSMTRRTRVVVRLDPVVHRIIEVVPDGVPFGPSELRELIVDLSYAGPVDTFARRFVFTAGDAPAEYFEYDLPAEEPEEYEVTVERRYHNGMVVRSEPVTTAKRRFTVPTHP
ncbi:hypothetical protein [Virgisporangium aurantiacum]|uniref:Uncharacterized protein n=1 Tax=Virgisporangium aurantiacum TaxID=175570 RepID=A0A8J3Z496_9ACTN|nr:hypothetical protein [Virgisporangium aurantiacum]GIJ57319.1 hypothetical protein Vau01_048350 [Virgisporangium aurantiacum]